MNQIRLAVDAWRAAGYPGLTATSRRLLEFWFDNDHRLADGQPFRFYYCQREAVETLVLLFEVERITDCADLVSRFFKSPDLLELDILTSSKGERFIRRYIPEIGKSAGQELPKLLGKGIPPTPGSHLRHPDSSDTHPDSGEANPCRGDAHLEPDGVHPDRGKELSP